MASRAAVSAFVEDRSDRDGNVSSNALTNLARRGGFGKEPYMKAIEVIAVLMLEQSCLHLLDARIMADRSSALYSLSKKVF